MDFNGSRKMTNRKFHANADKFSEELPNISNRGEKCLAKFASTNNCVFGSLTLDPRKAGDYSQRLPAAVRVCYEGKKIFLGLGEKYTMSEWVRLCDYEKSGRRVQLAERERLKNALDKVEDMTNQLIEERSFSLKKLRDRFQGKGNEGTSIYTIWSDYIQEKKDLGKAGTARVGKDILNRFIKDNGEQVELVDINHAFVLKWAAKMKRSGLSATYIGIALRSFRTIVNLAIGQGLINDNTKTMFKGSGYNQRNSRKHEFLDVATMRKLYEFWVRNEAKDENGNELFLPREKEALFRYLGLFLFMYLGDGQNLADTLRLEYDGWYFATHGQQLRFLRQKTRERSESASEVIFPITPEIKEILSRLANKPRLGQRVFPIMSPHLSPEQEVWVVQRYNKYIRQHMAKVAKLLGMEQRPSPTWARHSFATNLNNSGRVPYKYISDSMGHSGSGDITSIYLGTYPLERMLEYNSYLLNEEKPVDNREALIKLLRSMSARERAALLDEVQTY